MDLQNRRAIRNQAAQTLAAASGNPQNTVLIYAGGTAILALLVSAINELIGIQINNTGGLGNMGLRSILATVQYILPLLQGIVTLCLGFGYYAVVLRIVRHRQTSPQTLLEGIRYAGPLLRWILMQAVIYLALGFLSLYVASQIFVMLPVSREFLDIMMPIISSTSVLNPNVVLDDATLAAASSAMLPVIPIFAVLFVVVAAPIYYQYRMTVYALLDDPRKGVIAAMRASSAMLKNNRFKLFRLDLDFWWFYAMELLIGVIAYGDVLLPMVGVSFPWSETFSYYLFYVLSLALQTGLYYLFLNRVHVTYATVYEGLKPEPQQPKKVALGNIFEM